MQGVKDFLVLLILALVAAVIAYWRGMKANRRTFQANLRSGTPIQKVLEGHKGAFHGPWLLGAGIGYAVLAAIVSWFLPETMNLDLDTNKLLGLAVLIGAAVFGAASQLFKKRDRVPPAGMGSDCA